MSTSAQSACPVLIIGAGISGLACAYHLQQAGIPVNIVEAGTRPGGVIATKEKDGFRFDLGPQSFLTTQPLLELIDSLGIKDQLQYADRRAPRYILLRGQLVPAPMSPPSLLSTVLFSGGTKWRLLTEMMRRTKSPADDESIAAFVRRKFGPELLERMVAPFVSGVYAGDPERLSMRASFPKIHEFESQYGSVLRGAMKSRPPKGTPRGGLCAFRNGMETLPRAVANRLGDSVRLETSVTAIRHGKANGKPRFEIDITRRDQHETLAASAVILATPTQVTSQLLASVSDSFAPVFSRIEYSPVNVLSACYRRDQFQRQPDGFGFLVPRTEGLHVLGTVFNSSLFPGRAPQGMVALTSFSGGATDPQFCELSEQEITETICSEVARVLVIKGNPSAINLQRYARALPQYNIGHTEIIKSLDGLAASVPGLFLAGNYLSGPSIGSCVEQAFRTADAARNYFASVKVNA
ncbi:MAG TPA: protoporphyrinogen oxidase [Candidatus Acidoferrales bacterium]|nr:protoporphyrinogen oxidase [Candidatus Acidoferrales bacterium]